MVRRFLTNEAWQKECQRRLDEALEDTDNAKKALKAILKDGTLARELPKKVYLKIIRQAL